MGQSTRNKLLVSSEMPKM